MSAQPSIAVLPDADALAALDRAQLQPSADEEARPWLPEAERDRTRWSWLHEEPAPF